MALRFTTSSTNNVSLGTATSILPDTFTVLSWFLIRDFSGTAGYSIIERTTSTFADYRGVNISGGTAGHVTGFCRRGSPSFTEANVEAQCVVPHEWQFIAVQIQASGSTATNQKILFGDEHNVAREPSTYSSQTAGSGATSIQAGDTVRIGNNDGNNTSGFPGLIHFVGVWNRLLSKDEIAYWQAMTLRNRIKQSQGNTVFMYLNGGSGRQRDYSGAANHGTVTGAHAAALAPRAPNRKIYLFGSRPANTVIDCNPGVLTLTGQDCAIETGSIIACDPGVLTLTGQDVTLQRHYVLPCDPGALSLTGQAAQVTRTVIFTANVGTMTLTGQDVTLQRHYVVNCEAGVLNLTGQDAAVETDVVVACEAGALTLTGQDVTLQRHYVVNCEAGVLNLTGQDAAVQRNYVVTCDAGALTLTGQDVELIQTTVYNVDAGALTLTGQDAAIQRHYVVNCDPGVLNLTGQDCSIETDAAVLCEAGVLNLTGQDAAIQRHYRINCDAGVLNLTGQDCSIETGSTVICDAGVLNLTGQDVTIQRHYVVTCDAGVLTLTGQDASIDTQLTFTPVPPLSFVLNNTGRTSIVIADESRTITIP